MAVGWPAPCYLAAMLWAGGVHIDGAPDNPYPAHVVNLSLGSEGGCPIYYQEVIDELARRGVAVVASAGNEGGPVDSPANCAGAIAVAGLRHVGTKVGFSSLGPEVLAETFAQAPGFPKLHVLDSTDPAQVRSVRTTVKIDTTLFIVSSKSGGTTEPNVMKAYFFDEVSKAIGADKAGGHFVAVTDPGSSLEKVAKQQNFAHIFHGEPTIGGRYSVLSPFGLVPAAAAGLDLDKLLDLTLAMVRSCGPDVPPAENPGVQLGLAMGCAGLDGRDKVTIVASPAIASFGAAIALAVNSTACLLDLEHVVIDGSMHASLRDALCAATDRALDDYDWAGVTRPQLLPGSIGTDARAIGGALLPLHANFAPDRALFLKAAAITPRQCS